MKKYTGNYTISAGKALKTSDRLICRTSDEGEIYVTNGYVAYKMIPPEYAAIVQPVVCCEAGNWNLQSGEKREEATFDLVKSFRDSVDSVSEAAALEHCPLTLTTSKNRTAAAYYNAEKDFVALYDTRYISALCPGFTLRAAGTTSAAIAYNGKEPFALVLPIRPDDKTTRAVKAYFTQAADAETNEAEQLRAELARLQDKLARSEAGATALQDRVQQQADEANRLNAKIATLEDELSTVEHNNAELQERVTQQAEEITAANDNNAQPAADPKTAAEIIASRFTGMDGVTATIKGAHTAAPVVWLSGDTDKHADEIKAAGAKWSGKRSAYYVRVA